MQGVGKATAGPADEVKAAVLLVAGHAWRALIAIDKLRVQVAEIVEDGGGSQRSLGSLTRAGSCRREAPAD